MRETARPHNRPINCASSEQPSARKLPPPCAKQSSNGRKFVSLERPSYHTISTPS
jgi:hypothetical protein